MRSSFFSALSVRTSLAALALTAAFAAPLYAEEAAAPADAAPAMTPIPPAAKPVPAGDYVAAKVNGQDIKRSEINALLAIAFPGDDKPDYAALEPALQENVIQNIALERLILAEVKKQGFEKDPTLQQRIEFMRRQITMKTFLEHQAKGSVSEASLRDEYAKRIKAQEGKEEVHVRHILVKTEEEAKQVIARLKKGEDFAAVAQAKSSAKNDNGGDLGWLNKETMFPQLVEPAFALKKGEISKPIKTDFGWHVVKLEDRRKAAPQTFEQMKGTLEIEMRGKAEERYIGKLIQDSKIQMLNPDGTSYNMTPPPGRHPSGDMPADAPPLDAPKGN